jgi:aminocarboxymuconate-semialdehyde decarboxylase
LLAEARAQGCVGVEIATSIAGRRLDAPDFAPFWEAVDTLRIPVMIHPGYNEATSGLREYYLDNVIGNFLETTMAVERLICGRVLDKYSNVRILTVHGGGSFPYAVGRLRHAISVRPELAGAPRDSLSYPGRLFFDTVTHDLRTLSFLVSLVGSDNVVVGTDLPFDMATTDRLGDLSATVSTRDAGSSALHVAGITVGRRTASTTRRDLRNPLQTGLDPGINFAEVRAIVLHVVMSNTNAAQR